MLSSNCVDVVDNANAVGRVTTSGDASFCNSSETARLHGSKIGTCNYVGGGIGSSCARVCADCLMTTSGDLFKSSRTCLRSTIRTG